jgi:hypothetical protein
VARDNTIHSGRKNELSGSINDRVFENLMKAHPFSCEISGLDAECGYSGFSAIAV